MLHSPVNVELTQPNCVHFKAYHGSPTHAAGVPKAPGEALASRLTATWQRLCQRSFRFATANTTATKHNAQCTLNVGALAAGSFGHCYNQASTVPSSSTLTAYAPSSESPPGIFSPGHGSLVERQQRRHDYQSQKLSLWGIRRITINPSLSTDKKLFPTNRISYQAYTVWNFLPYALWRLFHRLTNVCLLFLAFFELIVDGISWEYISRPNLNAFLRLPPCIWALCWTIKVFLLCEMFNEYRRRRVAHERNNRICSVLSSNGQHFVQVKWSHLYVGNVIRLHSGQEVPADVVILASSRPEGVVFVDTQLVDGETRLKRRIAVRETQGDARVPTGCPIKGRLFCEPPSGELDKFTGTLSLNAHPRVAALDETCFVLQGSKLYGIDWAFAVVVYTGHQTRMGQQILSCRQDRSFPGGIVNRPRLTAVILVLCIICGQSLLNNMGPWDSKAPSSYLVFGGKTATFGSKLFYSVVQFAYFVPLSFSIACDITHIFQGFQISKCSNLRNGNKNHARSYNPHVNEILGRADFLITDKTGTLTDGLTMAFACCSIAARVYGNVTAEDGTSQSKSRKKCPTSRHLSSRTSRTGTQHIRRCLQRFPYLASCTSFFRCPWPRLLGTSPRCSSQPDATYFSSDSVSTRPALSSRKVAGISPHRHQTSPPSTDPPDRRGVKSTTEPVPRASVAAEATPARNNYDITLYDKLQLPEAPEASEHSVYSRRKTFQRSYNISRALPDGIRKRFKLRDARLLRHICRDDACGNAVRDMLLAMSLCNSVVPTCEAISFLMDHGSHLGPGSDPRYTMDDDKPEPVDDAASSSSVPGPITDDHLWTHPLQWNDVAIQFLKYQAEYPEEECTVAAATMLGCRLVWRSPSLVILERFGRLARFEVLGCNVFTSTRARTSLVVREENDDAVYLYCKGSDMAVLPLCSTRHPASVKALTKTAKHIRRFASHGLRTLVFARRRLTPEEWNSYQRLQALKYASMGHFCVEEIQRIVDQFESDLELLGVAGIRERVVRGAGDTIRSLTLAGVRVWIMTGDHADLALHIAYASKLLPPSALVFRATLQPRSTSHICYMSLRREIKLLYERFRSLLQTRRFNEPVALLMSGPDVSQFLSAGDLSIVFCSMMCCSDSVLFCRMTPQLKAKVVRLLKTRVTPTPIVLAVGDGANDIPMLREAHCGIAVGGNASQQSASAGCCDVLLPSIKELKPLLFIHGRLFRRRLWSTVLWLSFNGGISLGGTMMYGLLSNWSFVDVRRVGLFFCWEFFFMGLIAIVHGITFKDVSDHVALELPPTYTASRREDMCNRQSWSLEILEGVLVSGLSVLLLIAQYFRMTDVRGSSISVVELDVDFVTSIFLSCIFKLIISTLHTMSNVTRATLLLGLILTWYGVLFLGSTVPNYAVLHNYLDELPFFLHRDWRFWFRQPYLITSSFLTVFTLTFSRHALWPTASEKLLDAFQKYRPVPPGKVTRRRRVRRSETRKGRGVSTATQPYKPSSSFVKQHYRIVQLLPLPKQLKLIYPNAQRRALYCTLPFVSDIDRVTIMFKLKRQNRVRFLEEQLEVPSFELLPMSWGLRLTVKNLRQPIASLLSLGDRRSALPAATHYKPRSGLRASPSGDARKPAATVAGSANDSRLQNARVSKPTDTHSSTAPCACEASVLYMGDTGGKADKIDQNMADNVRKGRRFPYHETGHIADVLHLITLKFRDPQLESDYQLNRQYSVRELRKPYRCILLLFSILAVLVCIHDARLLLSPLDPLVTRADHILPCLFPDILILVSAFGVFHYFLLTDKLDMLLRCVYFTSAILRLVTDYFRCRDGIASASVFSVLLFVGLRVPFFHALLYNFLFTALFCVRYLYSVQYCSVHDITSITVTQLAQSGILLAAVRTTGFSAAIASVGALQLAHYLPLFLGIQAFTGFVGYRLEYNQRCGFFFNYQVQVAQRKQREMLNTMLPSFVVDQYLCGAVSPDGILLTLQPEAHGMVSVIFCDVHQFQCLVASVEPTHLVQVLDSLFLCFDKCAEQYHGTKIETVFETYLAATGLRVGRSNQSSADEQHAHNALELGLAMLEIARCVLYTSNLPKVPNSNSASRYQPGDSDTSGGHPNRLQRIRVKIGIHSGSVISGVVGVKKPQYALFGDTVNTASRMKATGKPDKIHVSESTYNFVKCEPRFSWDVCYMDVKGIGKMRTYLLRTPVAAPTHAPAGGAPAGAPPRAGAFPPSAGLGQPPSSQSILNTSRAILGREEPYRCPSVTGSSAHLYDPAQPHSAASRTILPQGFRPSYPRLTRARSLALALCSRCGATVSLRLRRIWKCCHRLFAPHRPLGREDSSACATPSSKFSPFRFGQDTGFSQQFGFLLRGSLLHFKDPLMEAKYRQQYYENKANINTIKHALLLFLMVFVIETWVVLHVPRQHLIGSSKAKPNVTWHIRASYCLVSLVFWFLLHHRSHRSISAFLTPRLLIYLLNFVFIAAGCTFVTVNSWGYNKPEPLKWEKLTLASSHLAGVDATSLPIVNEIFWLPNDTMQLFFYLTILHHSSGLLFRQVLCFSILFTVFCLIFFTLDSVHNVNAATICVTVVFSCINLISTYLKESVDRAAFIANEEMKVTEQRAQELLQDMLPRQVLREFQQDRLKLAYKHEGMSFLFADICHFTPWAKHVEPKEVVRLLQQLFYKFDHDSTRLGLYKLCTIGDAYVAVTEPVVSGDNPTYTPASGAQRVLAMANAMIESIRSIRARAGVPNLSMRIGVHYGECLGGVIGSGRLRYDLWGLDVLTGNMMETAGVPESICVSDAFRRFLNDEFPMQFHFTFHKTVLVIRKTVNCYLLTTRESPPSCSLDPSADLSITRPSGS